VSPNNGLGDLLAGSPTSRRTDQAIEADIEPPMPTGRPGAMVNSDKGITNLHVPSDVIVDASMPAMIRTSGQMWNADGKLRTPSP
jgi:isocitrate dehydrogenase